MLCKFTNMLAPRNFISAKATSRTPREREFIQNLDAPRPSFGHVDGDKETPVARSAQTSVLDNYQPFQRFKDFFDIRYVFDPAIKSSDAEGCVRVNIVSSRSLDFLTYPSSDDSTAVKANATKR
ncbi:hypothetical protein MTO96_018115 [Rhipicephalus appendiculatus]